MSFNAQAPDAGNMELLREFGTAAQKERWLSPLAQGEIRSCFAMTEPDYPGSNPVWMGTTARREADGYVIERSQVVCLCGRWGCLRDCDGGDRPEQADPHRRASMIIVPAGTPGFRRVRNISCMGHAGDDWASHAELSVRGLPGSPREPAGKEGAGFAMAQARLGPGRIQHCDALDRRLPPIARADVRPGAPGASSRPGDLLGSRQTVRNWIAESRAAIEAARLLVLHAAWTIDSQGIAPGPRGHLADQVSRCGRDAGGRRPRRSRLTGRSGSATTSFSRGSTARSGRRESTTDPTRCTRSSWRSGSLKVSHERGVEPMSFPIDQARAGT